MKRRQFLKGAAVASGAAVTGVAASSFPKPAISQDMRELKMVTTWPKNFPGLGTGAQRVADRITAATDGRLTVKLFAAGELVPAFESFDAVSSGTADCLHAAAYYWQGKNKAFNFFTAVPLGFTANELNAWVYHGGGQELWDELAAGFNLKGLLAGNTGVQMGGWFNKEINSLEDMKGLTMRMPGLGGEVLRRIGASAVALPGGEIFPALQSGAIDATEWVGPWNDLAFGFYKITKHYYYPGFHEPGSGLECTWNLDVWESFSDSDKELIKACCSAENDYSLAEFNARNGDSLATLIDEHGVQLHKFSDDIFNAIAKTSHEVVNEVGSEDDIGKRVLESYTAFRKNVTGWTALSDQSYADARTKADSA